MKQTIKLALFTSFLLLSSFKTQNNIVPEIINWDTHFQGDPDEHSAYAAITATTWSYSYTSTIRNGNLSINFKFLAGVDPTNSWVKRYRIKDKKVSRELLNHEQGHVYINFLLLKGGEITIKNQKYTVNNYKRLIQSTANKVSTYYRDLQDRYDRETEHGSNLNAQAKWDEYLSNELKKYNAR